MAFSLQAVSSVAGWSTASFTHTQFMVEVSFSGLMRDTPRTQLILDSFALCTPSLSGQLLHTPWALELHSGASQASLSILEGAFLTVPCPVTNCSEPSKLWATHF